MKEEKKRLHRERLEKILSTAIVGNNFKKEVFGTQAGGKPFNKVGVPIVGSWESEKDPMNYTMAGNIKVMAKETGVFDIFGREIYVAEDNTLFVYHYKRGDGYSSDLGRFERPVLFEDGEHRDITTWAELKAQAEIALAEVQEAIEREEEEYRRAEEERKAKVKKILSVPALFMPRKKNRYVLPKTKEQVQYLVSVVTDAYKAERRRVDARVIKSIQKNKKFDLEVFPFERVSRRVIYRLERNAWKYDLTGVDKNGEETKFKKPLIIKIGLLEKEEEYILKEAQRADFKFFSIPIFPADVFFRGAPIGHYPRDEFYLSRCGKFLKEYSPVDGGKVRVFKVIKIT